ncbi:ferritin-like domain-containing protein [Pseudotenacibaculum sp. MALMAid0570]|uniref:ferritin-like domain-containing protein n=1 Tax=Pseudotenacibaculum sp. MALMAid0570 TaxID=3143938 RepID=UPI0032DF732D
MSSKKLFKFATEVTPDNIEDVMQQAIALELATIPTYLSTYYSINRAQDQDKLYAKLHAQLSESGKRSADEVNRLAQELKVDILVYSNKAAALVMSVVIEEMLHLALSCNVKQAVCQVAPDLMAIGKVLDFPTQLDGHEPEFPINAAKLSLKQLTTFLQIESPQPFTDPHADLLRAAKVEYKTIGLLYQKIMKCIEDNFPGPYNKRPQLLPPEKGGKPRPFYSQNSMNTVHYDRDHNPHFANENDNSQLVGVYDAPTAIEALHLIVEQGEGSTTNQNGKKQHILEWGKDKMPIPMEVVVNEDNSAEVVFWPGDFEDEGEEPAHFAKFLEAYSLGDYYEKKFKKYYELDDFYSYFVYDQDSNPKQADYEASGNQALALANKLGNAVFAYILLMVETCYYKDEDTQYDLFMFGIHKSMILLLSETGNHINSYSYNKGNQAYKGALTFEPYSFEQSYLRPKEQILAILDELSQVDSYWADWGENYFPSLPDVGMDHSIIENVPNVPTTPYKH